MPHSTYLPERMGTATLSPTDPVEAGSFRIPDDRHRQDPEIRDARADLRQTRAEGTDDGKAPTTRPAALVHAADQAATARTTAAAGTSPLAENVNS
jgi:hypothetical protein